MTPDDEGPMLNIEHILILILVIWLMGICTGILTEHISHGHAYRFFSTCGNLAEMSR